jgi:hypothetical protein
MRYTIKENNKTKIVSCEGYNHIFRKSDGLSIRYGNTEDEDPSFSPVGPEILDWEISKICDKSKSRGNCKFCYKSNTSTGKYLDFDTFKKVFSKLPKSVCQIAYGIGSINGQPRLFDMLNYTRNCGIIPNITINGDVSDNEVEKFSKVLGAIAVSHYSDDLCFSAVERLCDASKQSGATLKQVNIHALWSSKTIDKCLNLLGKIKSDPRLKHLNALVLLSIKPKGRGKHLTSATYKDFKRVVLLAQEMGVPLGMDSCSAPQMLRVADETGQKDIVLSVEPCEICCFSAYLSVDCLYFPCSFMEGEYQWEEGIDILKCEDFIKDIWFNEKVNDLRKTLLNQPNKCDCKMKQYCRSCPAFNITPCYNGEADEKEKI